MVLRGNVKPAGIVKWWMTDPQGPAFEAAMSAMKAGFKKETVAIGCGGTIGFVGPLAGVLAGMRWSAANAPSARWIATAAGDAPLLPASV